MFHWTYSVLLMTLSAYLYYSGNFWLCIISFIGSFLMIPVEIKEVEDVKE